MTVITQAVDEAVRQYANGEITADEYFAIVDEQAARDEAADLAGANAK